MKELKRKIFEVISGFIPVKSFEEWLYRSDTIVSMVEHDAFVLDIVSINYNGKDCLNHLEKIALQEFNLEELLIFKVEESCKIIIKSEDKAAIDCAKKIAQHYSYDNDYELIRSFYYLLLNLDLIELGYSSTENVANSIKEFADIVLSSLNATNSFEERSALLRRNFLKEISIAKSDDILVKKKWFEFWK